MLWPIELAIELAIELPIEFGCLVNAFWHFFHAFWTPSGRLLDAFWIPLGRLLDPGTPHVAQGLPKMLGTDMFNDFQ